MMLAAKATCPTAEGEVGHLLFTLSKVRGSNQARWSEVSREGLFCVTDNSD